MKQFYIPNIGEVKESDGFFELDECSDKSHKKGIDGVKSIISTGDKKVELICYENYTIAYVKSSIGYPAYYPVNKVKLERPIKAVLMDLDEHLLNQRNFGYG